MCSWHLIDANDVETLSYTTRLCDNYHFDISFRVFVQRMTWFLRGNVSFCQSLCATTRRFVMRFILKSMYFNAFSAGIVVVLSLVFARRVVFLSIALRDHTAFLSRVLYWQMYFNAFSAGRVVVLSLVFARRVVFFVKRLRDHTVWAHLFTYLLNYGCLLLCQVARWRHFDVVKLFTKWRKKRCRRARHHQP